MAQTPKNPLTPAHPSHNLNLTTNYLTFNTTSLPSSWKHKLHLANRFQSSNHIHQTICYPQTRTRQISFARLMRAIRVLVIGSTHSAAITLQRWQRPRGARLLTEAEGRGSGQLRLTAECPGKRCKTYSDFRVDGTIGKKLFTRRTTILKKHLRVCAIYSETTVQYMWLRQIYC